MITQTNVRNERRVAGDVPGVMAGARHCHRGLSRTYERGCGGAVPYAVAALDVLRVRAGGERW